MMKSYNQSRWSAVFFISYLAINLYFLMNLMLAVVYDAFTRIEKDKFRRLFLHKRKAAQHAFKLLVTQERPEEVSFQHFEGLLSAYKPRACKLHHHAHSLIDQETWSDPNQPYFHCSSHGSLLDIQNTQQIKQRIPQSRWILRWVYQLIITILRCPARKNGLWNFFSVSRAYIFMGSFIADVYDACLYSWNLDRPTTEWYNDMKPSVRRCLAFIHKAVISSWFEYTICKFSVLKERKNFDELIQTTLFCAHLLCTSYAPLIP